VVDRYEDKKKGGGKGKGSGGQRKEGLMNLKRMRKAREKRCG
jgi:hypothetical protein